MTEEARIVEQKRGREDVTPNTPGLFENVITGKSSMVALPADALQSNQVQSYSANSNLSPRYTFDNFVVGNSNQVAVKVSWMVAEGSNQSYNPILLVGGTGTGKTHLLNAIGQYGLQLKPELKVKYVTAEQFTNELIEAMRIGKVNEFRRYYRNLDLLLLDDFQFLAGKEATKEEFSHLLDTLLHNNRQVVIASSRLPGEMSNLQERLRSRLQGGVVAVIQPADYELRFALLRHKASKAGRVSLSAQVLEVIARQVSGSLRDLEGTLNSLVVYAEHHALSLTPEITRSILEELQVTGGKES